MKKDDISNISHYKVLNYFFFVILLNYRLPYSGVMLSICRPGSGLSVVAIATMGGLPGDISEEPVT